MKKKIKTKHLKFDPAVQYSIKEYYGHFSKDSQKYFLQYVYAI